MNIVGREFKNAITEAEQLTGNNDPAVKSLLAVQKEVRHDFVVLKGGNSVVSMLRRYRTW